MERMRFNPLAKIARGVAAVAVGASVMTTPAYGESLNSPTRDQYYKPFEQTFLQVPPTELKTYIKDPEGNLRTRAIVMQNLDNIVPLFQNKPFHYLSRAEVEQDLNIYFDMYWAGWEKYQIPFYMLWIMHIQESNVSRDAKADTNGDGAMQVIRGNLGMPGITEAPDGYRSLELRPQRLSTRGGNRTTDSDEILRGAAYLRLFAEDRKLKHPSWYGDNDEAAILDVVHYDYSAEEFGSQRVEKYKQLKAILEPAA